jgi:ABC-type transporter Mla MlaB component
MLRIQRHSNSSMVIFSLSGRIEVEDAGELQRLLDLEGAGQQVALDLRDITLVDRDALKLLARWEAEGIKLENCPAYVREWIDTERGRSSRQKH